MKINIRISSRCLRHKSFDQLEADLLEAYQDEVSLGRLKPSPLGVYLYSVESTGDWKPTSVDAIIHPVLRETKHKYVIHPHGEAKPRFVHKKHPGGKFQLSLIFARHKYCNNRRSEHDYLLMRILRCAKQLAIFEEREAKHMLDRDDHEASGW